MGVYVGEFGGRVLEREAFLAMCGRLCGRGREAV